MLGFILGAQDIAARFLSSCDWVEAAMVCSHPIQRLTATNETDAQKCIHFLEEVRESRNVGYLALEQMKPTFLESISQYDALISLRGLIVEPAEDDVFCHPSFRKIMLSLNPNQLILRDIDDASLLQISEWLPLLKDLKGLSLNGWFQGTSLRILAAQLSSSSQLQMLSIYGHFWDEGILHLSQGVSALPLTHLTLGGRFQDSGMTEFARVLIHINQLQHLRLEGEFQDRGFEKVIDGCARLSMLMGLTLNGRYAASGVKYFLQRWGEFKSLRYLKIEGWIEASELNILKQYKRQLLSLYAFEIIGDFEKNDYDILTEE